jgi:N-acetylmuramoyl-L-alanine amidase
MHRSPRPFTRALNPLLPPHPSTRLVSFACSLAFALACGIALAPDTALAARVFIDPGHGGALSGASYGGVKESNLNLAVARQLDSALQARGHQTRLSRTSDVKTSYADIPTWTETNGVLKYATNGEVNLYDDLQARCNNANAWGADVFISIHANASTSASANGAETYWRNESTTDRVLSQRLASYIQTEYVLETGLTNRGVKEGRFYVLRWSNMPAVLIETGFMSNSAELRKLVDPSFQAKSARAIAKGVDRFLATDPFTAVYPRIAGSNRYATAVAIANSGWTSTGGTAILASGTNWPDALAGAPLSKPLAAPLLLAEPDRLPDETRARLATQRPTRIVILGGESAVSSATLTAAVTATGLEPSAVSVERLEGSNRYETATKVARRMRLPASGRIFLASGRDFADALSVGSYAGADGSPILLADPEYLPGPTREYLEEFAAQITDIHVIGGSVAISEGVAAQLAAFGTVTRVAGPDRYRTNLAVISRYGGTGALAPYVASATSFPDALSAATLAAKNRRPVLLVGERYLPPYTREFLYNNRARVADPTVVGGPAAVAYQTDWMIRKGFGR